jgi:MFS family permease
MWRTVLGILLGIVTTMIVISLVEALGHAIYPPPDGLDPSNPEHVGRIIAIAPTAALAMVVLAWCVGTFVGGWLGARIARHPRIAALASAFVVMFGVIAMIKLVPEHPTWMAVLGLLLPVPLALIAAKVAQRREKTLPK